MASFPSFTKIANAHHAWTPLMSSGRGKLSAIVQLAKHDHRPSYMTILGQFSPGFMRAHIPCDALHALENDINVISVEIREHICESMEPAFAE